MLSQVTDLEEADRQLKAGVVNVLFLSELSRAGLLPPKLLMGCLETLLAKIKSQLESKSPGGDLPAFIPSLCVSQPSLRSVSS